MWSVRRQSMYVYILKIICSTLSQIQTKFERVNKCKIKMSLYFWDWLCPVSTLRVSPKLPQLFNHPISPWKGDLDFDRKVLSGVASKKRSETVQCHEQSSELFNRTDHRNAFKKATCTRGNCVVLAPWRKTEKQLQLVKHVSHT